MVERAGILVLQAGKLCEDAAAALHLFAQQGDVLGHLALGRREPGEFARDERDGAERRAEVMRSRRRESVELREMLLARQHQLGRRQRVGEIARLLGDAPGVDAGEGEAQHERDPVSELVVERQHRPVGPGPGQRQVKAAEQGRERRGKQSQSECALRRQGRRRDQHRGEEQEGEGVLQPSGHVEQGGELDDVEGEQRGGGAVLQAVAQRKAHAQRDVEPGRDGDDAEAPAEGQEEAEAEMDAGDGDALPGNGQPAQPHQGVEPQMPARARRGRRRQVQSRHRAQALAITGIPQSCRGPRGRFSSSPVHMSENLSL